MLLGNESKVLVSFLLAASPVLRIRECWAPNRSGAQRYPLLLEDIVAVVMNVRGPDESMKQASCCP